MPNSFDIPTTDFYIKQGSYASLAEAAQAQSIILYDAYKELEFYWEDVHLFILTINLRKNFTPRASSVSNTDEIHPRYDYDKVLL
jgi:hypothetical protein